ncbi:hypothetical protein RFI_04442, partial [Reticulomyxa filosa]
MTQFVIYSNCYAFKIFNARTLVYTAKNDKIRKDLKKGPLLFPQCIVKKGNLVNKNVKPQTKQKRNKTKTKPENRQKQNKNKDKMNLMSSKGRKSNVLQPGHPFILKTLAYLKFCIQNIIFRLVVICKISSEICVLSLFVLLRKCGMKKSLSNKTYVNVIVLDIVCPGYLQPGDLFCTIGVDKNIRILMLQQLLYDLEY